MLRFLSSNHAVSLPTKNAWHLRVKGCLHIATLWAVCTLLISCTTELGGDEPRRRSGLLTEKDVYERAIKALESNRANVAIEQLQLLEARFPFGVYYAHFSELLIRFPESPYGADARQRLIFLRNLLARHEISVANYYFERGAYMAATNRGRFVVENFQGSPAVADALAVLAQGYTIMGHEELADNSIAVLYQNFPDHPALDDEGNFKRRSLLAGDKRTVLNRLSFGLLDRPEPLGYDTRNVYNPEIFDSKLISSEIRPQSAIFPN